MQTQTKILEDLFNAGVHLGHKKNRVHPKAQKYIYKMESGTSIIDLTQTVDELDKAKQFLSTSAQEGKTLLVVSTKKISSVFITELCQKYGIPYVTLKWPAGLITNFKTIMLNVKKLKEMKEEKEKGTWDKFVKHEQMELTKKMNKLDRIYGGLVNLEKLPDIILTLDIRKEKNAVKEASSVNIPIVAIADTNVNPDLVNYPVVGNDDSESSIQYLMTELIDAYTKGKEKK